MSPLKRILLLITTISSMMIIYITFPRIEAVPVPLVQEMASQTMKSEPDAKATIAVPSQVPSEEEYAVAGGAAPTATQEFLERIDAAERPEDVFQVPSNHVVANQVDGKWISQGDMLVSEKQLVKDVGTGHTRFAHVEKVDLWPNNIVPYRIEPTLDPNPIVKAISSIHQSTHVRFVPHRDERDFVYFRAHKDSRCLSHLGRIGGPQDILLNGAACGYGKILHEIMHALGFVHEHSRDDRDNHVIVHWDQIKESARHDFQKLSEQISKLTDLPFDYESIMLYPSHAYRIGSSPTITKLDGTELVANREGLSQGDIQKINALYPKAD